MRPHLRRPPHPEKADSGGGATRITSDSMIDPLTLMRIKSLEVRAKVVVDGLIKGIHRSPYFGFSVEFSEYRQYSSGDDPRYLDWRLYARSDRYYIKRFEDETNLRCTFLLDTSRSMSYGSGAYSKGDYARTLVATLAYFLTTQRDAIGLVTFEDRVENALPARHRPGHLRRMMNLLERDSLGRSTDLIRPLQEAALLLQKRGLVVLVSDFLAPVESLKSRLGYLKARGNDIALLRILDPAEITFNFSTPAMFHDLETGRDLYVDPITAKEQYAKRFVAHSLEIEQACSDLGVSFASLSIDQPLELVLFEFLRMRSRRGSKSFRRQTSRKGGLR